MNCIGHLSVLLEDDEKHTLYSLIKKTDNLRLSRDFVCEIREVSPIY